MILKCTLLESLHNFLFNECLSLSELQAIKSDDFLIRTIRKDVFRMNKVVRLMYIATVVPTFNRTKTYQICMRYVLVAGLALFLSIFKNDFTRY